MSEKDNSKEKISFKDTLNLPTTGFPIRPNAAIDDPAMVARWEQEQLFAKTFSHNRGNESFILHDGPPYANGHIHLGHAYNKVLKDITAKAQRMLGKYVPVTPGWDCHGLPIEFNVTKEEKGLSRTEIKKRCRAYAQTWVDTQKDEFKRLGVLMDWENPYLTMNFGYEASILQAFGIFVKDGFIERKNKTVAWCAHCQTVLAMAEIEHQDRKDPSVYVEFPLKSDDVSTLFPQVKGSVSLLVWTTTPWTLPLNRAVVLKPDATYVLLEIKGKQVILGKDLAAGLCKKMDAPCQVLKECKAEQLGGIMVHHPFIPDLQVPVIFDPFVSLDEGTACVHTAPGCGPEDYEIALKNNLEIFSPLSADGKYTEGIMPEELLGMPIADGQIWVIKKLVECDKLLYKTSYNHSYPHCWRCRNGLMFRATKQWFVDLSKHHLKEKALAVCDTIKTYPEKSVSRLKASIESRLEWCISRQRAWGVPITALICTSCDEHLISDAFIKKIAAQVETQGIEYWDTVPVEDLIEKGMRCTKCGGTDFKKETDILDVWFDSGVSHFAVLQKRDGLSFPANLYMEGKDQHRGWFQSSLLSSMVMNGKAPMKELLTHGFTVDAKGKKMSKSLGNVILPQEMIDQLGTDGLRLWVASIDCEGEAIVSDALIKNVQQVFRKVRNTARFLLSNLYDFDIEKDAVPLDQMLLIDKYGLEQLFQVNQEILNAYDQYDFTGVFHRLADYCTVELSSFYLDIVKDRLYVEKSDGNARRSAQTTCWYILDTLTRLIAPIFSFTAEQISDYYQKNKKESIHLQSFANLNSIWNILEQDETKILKSSDNAGIEKTKRESERLDYFAKEEKIWSVLKDIRSAVLKAIEGLREQKIINHSLEAHVTIYFDLEDDRLGILQDFYKKLDTTGQELTSFFKEFMIVSQCDIAESRESLEPSEMVGVFVKVQKASGDKCPRCWQWEHSDHKHKLCSRCQRIVNR